MTADEPPFDRPRDLWRIAVPAYGPSVLASIGLGAIFPVLALSARELGASVGLAAGMIGLLGLGGLAAGLPAGAMVARIGERRSLMLAGVGQAAVFALAMVAPSPWVLAIAAVLLGSSMAVFHLARQSYLTAAVPLPLRARALSTLGGMHRVGLFVGPLIGSWAIWMGGLWSAYVIGIVAALASAVLVRFTRDLTAGHETRLSTQRPEGVFSVIAANRRVLATLGTGVLVVAAARATRNSLLPLWAADGAGLDPAQTSLVFAIAGGVDMLLFYPAGAIMDRYGRVWTAVPAVVILGLGFLLLPLSTSMTTVSLVAVLMAIGNGLGSGIVMTLGADVSPLQARPQFLAGWRVFTDIGVTGGPLLIGAVTAVTASLPLACIAMGGLTLAGAGWLGKWVPRYPPGSNT